MSSVATHHNEFAARPPTDRSCRICNPLMPVTDRQTDRQPRRPLPALRHRRRRRRRDAIEAGSHWQLTGRCALSLLARSSYKRPTSLCHPVKTGVARSQRMTVRSRYRRRDRGEEPGRLESASSRYPGHILCVCVCVCLSVCLSVCMCM